MQPLKKLVGQIQNHAPGIREKLDRVYNIDPRDYLIKLLEFFARSFPDADRVTVLRAPGRVNLIGEHTDYNGLPVLPMAIDHDMLVALRPRTDRNVSLVNPDFPERSFDIQQSIPRSETGDWCNYVKAGVQGIADEFGDIGKLRGFDACFLGTVPVGAGLSSSSTLVVASAMATLQSSGLVMEPISLAERMARAEWYVGTQGGGMDHAASILSEKGKALKIDFFPLRVKPANIPDGYSIVVANSMVVAAKTGNTRMHYNLRPAVCRMAFAMLVKKLGLEKENLKRLGDLYFSLGRKKIRRAMQDTFTRESYTKSDLAAFLGLTVDQVEKQFCITKGGELLPEPDRGFKVHARARHVFTESARVEDSVEATEAGDGEAFGALMNASHASCRDDYEISHPALEDLVSIGLEAGSSGSRLTGAGFGGCTVHLVQDRRLGSFLEQMKDRYYGDLIHRYPEAAERCRKNPGAALLALRPAGGARVLF